MVSEGGQGAENASVILLLGGGGCMLNSNMYKR